MLVVANTLQIAICNSTQEVLYILLKDNNSTEKNKSTREKHKQSFYEIMINGQRENILASFMLKIRYKKMPQFVKLHPVSYLILFTTLYNKTDKFFKMSSSKVSLTFFTLILVGTLVVVNATWFNYPYQYQYQPISDNSYYVRPATATVSFYQNRYCQGKRLSFYLFYSYLYFIIFRI